MCQISAVLVRDGRQEKIMDSVTELEVTPEGIRLVTLFEEPKLLPGARITKIDFMGGTLTLAAETTAGEGK
jgi:predicted RNA-binding protein